jgi:ABC-type microcin C transport system duplicated ATPase subunit YejF
MTLLEVADLRKQYRVKAGGWLSRSPAHTVAALRGVSLTVSVGETVGIVGETGAGKTTLGRCIVGLERADAGVIHLNGKEITNLQGEQFRRIRRQVQVVFQDSFASMNPRHTVGEIIEEPLRLLTDLRESQREEAVAAILAEVELSPEIAIRYRHELSGGQQQRVNVARAMVIHPNLVVLDEPVSALDASVRGAVIALLKRLQSDHQLAYMMIAHDLHVVREISTRVVIMYDGQVLESGSVEQIFDTPVHPYTHVLLASALPLDYASPGEEPSPVALAVAWEDRDAWKTDATWVLPANNGTSPYPPLRDLGDGHLVAIASLRS